MKRAALIFAIVGLLLLADGSYLQVTHNNVGGDNGYLFGNQNINLSAGFIVLLSGGALLLAAIIMWLVAMRRRDEPADEGGQVSQFSQATKASQPAAAQAQAEQAPAAKAAAAQAEVGVGPGQIGKGRGDQRDS
jgi:hypothetical protein